jgi:CPA2 family monovalent cation:H+ antiporter-2
MRKKQECPHWSEAQQAQPETQQCKDCGSTVNLRVCMTCGYVGCCESQKAHNTLHARKTNHPIIRSLPLSERSFTWCYECRDYLS